MATNASDISELRAELARRRMRVYELVPCVQVHPACLGAMLSERLPMRPELAARVAEAIRAMPAREVTVLKAALDVARLGAVNSGR
jgi:hypothetical protein